MRDAFRAIDCGIGVLVGLRPTSATTSSTVSPMSIVS
jgi:hypothetical protein